MKTGQNISIITEGRDVGSVVFLNERVKFFLTASPEARAKRRCTERVSKDRDTAPLRVHEEAIYLDHVKAALSQ